MISLVEVRHECLEERLLLQSSHFLVIYSILRHSSRPGSNVWVQFDSSCYHVQHYPLIQESRHTNTRELPQDKQGHQHPYGSHICLVSGIARYVQPETANRPLPMKTRSFYFHDLLYLCLRRTKVRLVAARSCVVSYQVDVSPEISVVCPWIITSDCFYHN